MKKFLLYITIVFVPICVGIPIVNYVLDPGHIYSIQYIDDVVEGAKKGLNVTNVSNIDERLYKKKLIEINRGKTYDYLILGSSRLLTLSGDPFENKKVLNLAVSGAKIEDMIALFQICKTNDIHFDNVIIGADPTLFNDNDNDSRWKSIGEYYYIFFDGHNNKIKNSIMEKWMLFENLYSLSYFKSALKSIPSLKRSNSNIEYVKTYINEGGTKRTDGSIYYARSYRETPQEDIDNSAKSFKHQAYTKFNRSSKERQEMFVSLIDAIKKESHIFFFCSPYHPTFYKSIKDVGGFQESMSYIKEYANTNGISIIGNFNPDAVDFNNYDFYDAVHARKESVDNLIKNFINA